jgi:hypothetical protein
MLGYRYGGWRKAVIPGDARMTYSFPDHYKWTSHRYSWNRRRAVARPTGLVAVNTGEAMQLSTVACLVRE